MKNVSPLEGAIADLQAATTTPELVRATKNLCKLRTIEAIPKLIEVLGFNNPAVASVATAGLIDLGSQAVPSLLVSLDEKNYGSRAWVVRALAAIHDPRSLDLLEYALTTDIAPSVRRSAARGLAELNLIYPEDSLKLNRCLLALLTAIKDDEWVVRYSAIFGIEMHLLKYNSTNKNLCILGLKQLSSNSEPIKVIRLRATLALQRLNPS